MTDQRSFFSSFKEIDCETWKVNGIGGAQLNAMGIGTIPVYSYVHGERKNGEFHDVLFVPGLGTNLFSIGIATDSHRRSFHQGHCCICEERHRDNVWPKSWQVAVSS